MLVQQTRFFLWHNPLKYYIYELNVFNKHDLIVWKKKLFLHMYFCANPVCNQQNTYFISNLLLLLNLSIILINGYCTISIKRYLKYMIRPTLNKKAELILNPYLVSVVCKNVSKCLDIEWTWIYYIAIDYDPWEKCCGDLRMEYHEFIERNTVCWFIFMIIVLQMFRRKNNFVIYLFQNHQKLNGMIWIDLVR